MQISRLANGLEYTELHMKWDETNWIGMIGQLKRYLTISFDAPLF